MGTHPRSRHAAIVAILLAMSGCREPTEAVIDITTDAVCGDVGSTGITPGRIGDIEAKRYGTTTTMCSAGADPPFNDIGSLVLLPPEGDREAPFAVKVVLGLGVPADDCVAPDYGPRCIVARRAMRFVPHTPFHVPVKMRLSCAGVICAEDQTCVDGVCQSVTVDPIDCLDPDGCEPPPVDVPPWTKHVAGFGAQMARHLAVGADGTLAVTGNFDPSIDLGGGPLSAAGDDDIFVATYAPTGALRWAASFGGQGLDEGLSVAIDAASDIYLLARIENIVTFGDDELVSKGSSDVALVKIKSFGEIEWTRRLGAVPGELPSKVAVGADGDVYVTGQFEGSTDIAGTPLTSAGGADIFFARFSSQGDLKWAKALGGAGDDGANGLGVDAGGRVYLGGYFEGAVDFGDKKPRNAAGNADAFVASFDADGRLGWVKTFGANASDRVFDLTARDHRVVATGVLSNKVEIDRTPLEAGAHDGFVVAFEADGTVAWGRVFGGDGDDEGKSISLTADGGVILGGVIFDGSVFGSDPIAPKGIRSPFVAVLDRDGNPLLSQAFASSLYADLTGVAAAPDGASYAAGWFTDELALDDAPITSKDAEDMFLLRLPKL